MDLIDRQAAIDAAVKMFKAWYGGSVLRDREIRARFDALPSAQPEYKMDEWCHDCKEYDSEKHCCPRWNRVIRETLRDAQPMRWIPCSERLPEEPSVKDLETRMFLVCVQHTDYSSPNEPPYPFVYQTVQMDHYDGEVEGWREWDTRTWDADEICYSTDVTAWMPLPEPWRGDAE